MGVLIYVSLMASDVDHLFICLFAVCKLSSEMSLRNSLLVCGLQIFSYFDEVQFIDFFPSWILLRTLVLDPKGSHLCFF